MAVLDFTAYQANRVLAKLTVPQLAPNVQAANVQQGTNTVGTSQVTVLEGIEGQTATSANFVAEGLRLRIRPPIDANGSRPDVLLTISVGKTVLEGLQIVGTDALNMFPLPDRLQGGPEVEIPLALSTLQALQIADAIAKGQAAASALPPNLPLELTGVKVGPDTVFTFTFVSSAGWGQNGAAIQPLEVSLIGDVVRSDVLAVYGVRWPLIKAFGLTRPPFGGFAGSHEIPGDRVTAETWTALPGGTAQKGPIQIDLVFIDAVNANPISATAPRYVFSNLTSVGGVPNSVTLYSNPSDYKDAELGDVSSTTAAFVWRYLGFAFDPALITSGANPEMYIGIRLDNQLTIPGNGNGRLVTLRDNPFAWGRAYPQAPDGARYKPLPSARVFGTLLSYGVGVAPQVSVQGLTQLGAKSVHVLKGGVRVSGPGLARIA